MSTVISTLDPILQRYVADEVSLQKRCNQCTGSNDKCDYCTVLRHKPVRAQLEQAGIYLKRYAEDDQEDDSGFKNSFLTGSLARQTSIRPPKDVDFFVVLDEQRFGASRPSAVSLLEAIKATLLNLKGKNIFGSKIVDVDYRRRAVRVKFEDDFCVDVIPAFESEKKLNGEMLYDIPDGDLQCYLLSNPKIHLAKLRSAVSEEDLPKLRDIIKLIRRWRRDAFNDRDEKPKSFHLEMVAIQIFEGQKIGSYIQALDRYFNSLPDYIVQPRMPDPASPQEKRTELWIDGYLRDLLPADRDNIQTKVLEAGKALREALTLELSDQPVRAIERLRTVFKKLSEQEPEKRAREMRTTSTRPVHANVIRTQPWHC